MTLFDMLSDHVFLILSIILVICVCLLSWAIVYTGSLHDNDMRINMKHVEKKPAPSHRSIKGEMFWAGAIVGCFLIIYAIFHYLG